MTWNLTVNRQNDLFLTVKETPLPHWEPRRTETFYVNRKQRYVQHQVKASIAP